MTYYAQKALDRKLNDAKARYDAEVKEAEEKYKLRTGNLIAHYVHHATREEFARGPKQ